MRNRRTQLLAGKSGASARGVWCALCAVLALHAGVAPGQVVLSGRTVPYALRDRQPAYFEATVVMSEGCTITGVRVDASGVRLGNIPLVDDGVGDDGIAGNNVWGVTVMLPPGVTFGARALPIYAWDECGGASPPGLALAVHVLGQQDWAEQHDAHADAGEHVATAQAVGRIGTQPLGDPASAIWGHLSQQNGRDVDMYRVRVCDPALATRFVVQFAGTDIQLFLFNSAGMGIAHHDGLVTDLLPAVLDVQLGAGEYVVAVSTYNRDALSAGNLPIWLDQPRNVQHAPDGPGAGSPLVGWGGVPIATTATYNIIVHNVCRTREACDSIDFNGDGLFPDTQDIADFLSVFAGGVCDGQAPTDPPCNTDIDFNNDGLFPDTDDIASLLRVLAGGPCL